MRDKSLMVRDLTNVVLYPMYGSTVLHFHESRGRTELVKKISVQTLPRGFTWGVDYEYDISEIPTGSYGSKDMWRS